MQRVLTGKLYSVQYIVSYIVLSKKHSNGLFYFSYKQVKQDFSLLRAYAIICGRFNITVNWDYLHAQNQGKLASVCLHRFSSIFDSTIGS